MRRANEANEGSWIVPFSAISIGSIPEVGGQNAVLGEVRSILGGSGIAVPDGFAVTVSAYRRFLEFNGLKCAIESRLRHLGTNGEHLATVGAAIRAAMLSADMPPELAIRIAAAYRGLAKSADDCDPAVAIRCSSAVAGDSSGAGFAGQRETHLFVRGIDRVLKRCIECFASLYGDWEISRRMEMDVPNSDAAMSIGIHRMVRSDIGAAGVASSIDTETGFPDVATVDGAWGLGRSVVQGRVEPDEFVVFKPFLGRPADPILSRRLGDKQVKTVAVHGGVADVATRKDERKKFVLNDDRVRRLASLVTRVEAHFGRPMHLEWALDGITGRLLIVHARPEAGRSRPGSRTLLHCRVDGKGALLTDGVAIGHGAAAGAVRLMESADDGASFDDGDVLVTAYTDPDWLPIMRKAAAVVTDHGGRTSHAAITSRELGIPAITGTGDATAKLREQQRVTVSCCEGSVGRLYDGIAQIVGREVDLDSIPSTSTKVMLNLANPAAALGWWRLPADGIGLARMEVVIADHVQAHPLALARYDALPEGDDKRRIALLTDGWNDKSEFFVSRLAQGIATLAASVWPCPIIVRGSDFGIGNHAASIAGSAFEPSGQIATIGRRAMSREAQEEHAEAFVLECRALRRARVEMGFTNIKIMVPYCRTPDDGSAVIDALAGHGLKQGRDGLEIHAMCEIPSNIVMVDEFAALFDGLSIGSSDLTQPMFGIDRDCAPLRHLFHEDRPAMRRAIEAVIDAAHRNGRPIGLCGQAPSDNPAFARFLVDAGIDTISATPESFAVVKANIRDAELPASRPLISAAE